MARYTAEADAKLRDIAYSAGISVDRLIKLNPDLQAFIDEGTVGENIEGMQLRLGKDNKIEELETWRPGTDKATDEELEAMSEEERRRYDRQRGRRQDFVQGRRAERQEERNARLMQDTGFAAFMRQMGMDASEIENAFLDIKEDLRADRQKQMPLYADQALKAEQRENQSAEASGMFRSGQRLRDVADAVNAVDVNRQDFLDGLRESRREARETKNAGLASLERNRAEEEIAAAERLTARDAQTRFGV